MFSPETPPKAFDTVRFVSVVSLCISNKFVKSSPGISNLPLTSFFVAVIDLVSFNFINLSFKYS
jgi:hypothetical protein